MIAQIHYKKLFTKPLIAILFFIKKVIFLQDLQHLQLYFCVKKNLPEFIKRVFACCILIYCICFTQKLHAENIPNPANLVVNHDEDEEAVGTTDQAQQAKILNVSILTDIASLSEQTLYVGQYITITYSLVLLDEARIVYTEFNPSLDKKNNKNATVELVKEDKWQKDGNSNNYTASYTFKILKPKVNIPSLVVHVQNNYLQDSMQTDPIILQAQSLQKTANYCGVVANSLKIIDYTLESYDDKNNMILIELEGNNSNLEDFRLPNIKDQEFGQGSKFSSDVAHVNVLARIPKELDSIDFNYFDIKKHEFVPLSIKNSVNIETFDDDIKDDLNPKSSFLRFTNILLLATLGIFLLLTLIKRSYFAAIISCLLLGVIVYRIFSNTYSIKTLPNARVLIQPTKNSTELFVISNPTKLEAIDKKNDYYKVNIDSKVGWISRNDTNKR